MPFSYGPLTCKDFDIELLKKRESRNMSDNHFHDYYEIYYQLLGERRYFIRDRVYNVHKGEIVFINAYDLHKTMASGTPDYSRVLISFRQQFIENYFPCIQDIDLFYGFRQSANRISIAPGDQAAIEMLLFRMLEENKGNAAGRLTSLRNSLILLLIFITRNAQQGKNEKSENRSVLQERLFNAVQYINSHYSEKLALPETARMFGFSTYYFCKIFKEATGFTFVEYVNAVRIKQACRLLKETRMSVTDIALNVGFNNSTHFGRIFKNIVKVSPMKIRKAKT